MREGRSESRIPQRARLLDPEYVRKAIRNAGLAIGALHFSGEIDIDSDAGIEPTIAGLKEYAAYAIGVEMQILNAPWFRVVVDLRCLRRRKRRRLNGLRPA